MPMIIKMDSDPELFSSIRVLYNSALCMPSKKLRVQCVAFDDITPTTLFSPVISGTSIITFTHFD